MCAPGLSGLVSEIIQATGDIGTQWILDLCNGIVKEGNIPEDWKSSVVLPVYKGKGDPMECGSYNSTRSTQPCIPPGSLNRVPASAGVRAGISPLSGGR